MLGHCIQHRPRRTLLLCVCATVPDITAPASVADRLSMAARIQGHSHFSSHFYPATSHHAFFVEFKGGLSPLTALETKKSQVRKRSSLGTKVSRTNAVYRKSGFCWHLVFLLMFFFVPGCPCRKMLWDAPHHKQEGHSTPLKFPSRHTGAHAHTPLLPCSGDQDIKLLIKNNLNCSFSALAWYCHETGLRARSHQMPSPFPHTVHLPLQRNLPMWGRELQQ